MFSLRGPQVSSGGSFLKENREGEGCNLNSPFVKKAPKNIKGDPTRDNSQRRFLAQRTAAYIARTLFRHCCNIVKTLQPQCCAYVLTNRPV